jgi:methylglutaconyl-CoA hydratase
MAYQFLIAQRAGAVERVTLNRPDVRNAFNEQVIAELRQWALAARTDRTIRVGVIAGAGKAFSAGADVAWMARMVDYSHEQNLADAAEMARMFWTLDTLPFPLIGRIHGAALGGGAGLAAVCDVVVADESAIFGFTETKLGIVPAVVSPYVLAKIGRSAARELFLSGARFSAERAREIGLVHAVVPADRMDVTIDGYIHEFLSAGPSAMASAKALIQKVWERPPGDAASLTAETLATLRVSTEGREGLKAFLEKRRASWRTD